MKTVYDEIREKTMKDLLKAAEMGSQDSYDELITLLQKMVDHDTDLSFVSYMVSNLRQKIWPDEYKTPELLGVITRDSLNQLKNSYDKFHEKCEQAGKTSRG